MTERSHRGALRYLERSLAIARQEGITALIKRILSALRPDIRTAHAPVLSLRLGDVVPALVHYASDDLSRNHGKTTLLGLVLTGNRRMLRSITRDGRSKVGRLGYLQVGTFRLH